MGEERYASDFSDPAAVHSPAEEPVQHSGRDPSMEEILASIRRILAEEQDGSKFIDEPEVELLLDSSMLVSLPDALPILAPERSARETAAFTEKSPEPSAEPDKDHKMEDQIQRPEGLIDDKIKSQVVNSVGSLLRSVGADRSVGIGRQGITLEDMVREELKPMLKSWLDTHLPGLVERVVRTEINRLMDIARN